MANDGKPIGFLNAEEVTAFRTALASSLLMTRRSKVKTVTVFGAGKQAYVSTPHVIYNSFETPLTNVDSGMYDSLSSSTDRRFVTCT